MNNVRKDLYILLLVQVLLLACNDSKVPEGFEEDDHYYSVVYEMDNYWNATNHQPLVLIKTVSTNGQVDSSFQAWDSTFYNEMRSLFLQADISDQKYLGRYNFTQLKDETNNIITYSYEATEEKLFTRKYLINLDLYERFTSAYIETKSKEKSQKLLFAPGSVIQILETTFTPETLTTITNYKFP